MRHLLRLVFPASGLHGGSCPVSAGAGDASPVTSPVPAGERLAGAAVVAFLLLALFA